MRRRAFPAEEQDRPEKVAREGTGKKEIKEQSAEKRKA